MTEIFVMRDRINRFVKEYETWFLIIAKFIGMMFVFSCVNSQLGYFEALNNPMVNILLALICSIIPGSFSVFMTFLLGVKFIVKPVMTTKNAMEAVDPKKRFVQSVICGVMIGFICGFIGAGGGMMMLLILTSVLGYELKTAVGTSVFIMTFTAFTGAVSHFAIGGMPDLWCLVFCVGSTLLWARIAARFANKASPATLNRATGVVLVVLGMAIMGVNYIK